MIRLRASVPEQSPEIHGLHLQAVLLQASQHPPGRRPVTNRHRNPTPSHDLAPAYWTRSKALDQRRLVLQSRTQYLERTVSVPGPHAAKLIPFHRHTARSGNPHGTHHVFLPEVRKARALVGQRGRREGALPSLQGSSRGRTARHSRGHDPDRPAPRAAGTNTRTSPPSPAAAARRTAGREPSGDPRPFNGRLGLRRGERIRGATMVAGGQAARSGNRVRGRSRRLAAAGWSEPRARR